MVTLLLKGSTTRMNQKFIRPTIREAEIVEVSTAVDIYDRRLSCSRSRDSTHVRRRAHLRQLEHGDPHGIPVWP
jgi:hypothetical protein